MHYFAASATILMIMDCMSFQTWPIVNDMHKLHESDVNVQATNETSHEDIAASIAPSVDVSALTTESSALAALRVSLPRPAALSASSMV